MSFKSSALLAAPFLAGLAIVAQNVAAASTFKVGQTVLTSSGPIEGHPASWQPEVSEYLGIPFAVPPLGELRWTAPKPYIGNKTINAAKFSPDCAANVAAPLGSQIQYTSVADIVKGILGQAGDTFSEDCLTLNVWTKPQTGEKKKAVMVWIYGGGYSTGNSASPSYNGARLANDQDVIVVSINYRVNIFGFPMAKFMPDYNLGLLDQRLGLEWVRQNIEALGGDPKRIMLFGQSAGGGSVDMYSYAWTKDPIVNAISPMSGNAANSAAASKSSNEWFSVSKTVGCGGEEAGAKSLACMRSKDTQTILNAFKNAKGISTTQFRPTADNRVVFSDYAKRRAEGNFIKVPYLTGNTDDEGGISFAINRPAPKAPGAAPASKSNAVDKRQAPGSSGAANGLQGCGPNVAAAARIKAGVPAWRYLSSMVFPNSDIGSRGTFHGGDIAYVFGTQAWLTRMADTPEEKKFLSTIMTAWATFAKDPQNGLKKLGWPVYDPAKSTLIVLGGKNDSSVKFVNRKTFDVGC